MTATVSGDTATVEVTYANFETLVETWSLVQGDDTWLIVDASAEQ